MNGVYYQWYKGGRLAKSFSYLNGVLHGPSVICYDRGPIQEESNYKNGLRDGLTIWYNYADREQGSKYAAYNYKDGLFEGLQETYYDNGTVKSRKMFSNNVQNGMAYEFYEDGSVKQKPTIKRLSLRQYERI